MPEEDATEDIFESAENVTPQNTPLLHGTDPVLGFHSTEPSQQSSPSILVPLQVLHPLEPVVDITLPTVPKPIATTSACHTQSTSKKSGNSR